jgi:hypothetical protein
MRRLSPNDAPVDHAAPMSYLSLPAADGQRPQTSLSSSEESALLRPLRWLRSKFLNALCRLDAYLAKRAKIKSEKRDSQDIYPIW